MLRDRFVGRDEENRLEEGDARPAAKSVFIPPFRSSKAALRLRLYATLVVVDVFALLSAFAGANMVRFGAPLHIGGIEALVILIPIYLAIAFNSRAYAIDVLTTPRVGVKRSLKSLAVAVALVIGALFYLKASADFSRVAMALGTAGSIVLLGTARWLVGQWIGAKYDWRFTNEVIFVDEVAVLPARGQILIFANSVGLTPSISDPLLLDRLGNLLKHCDRVVLACPTERRAAWSAMMKGVDVNVEMMAPELDALGALGMGRVGNHATVLISHGPMGVRDQLIKRAFDLFVAIPALIIAAPLLGLIALAIKADSAGPVFFRQARMGQGNRVFHILKFRSMRAESTDQEGARSASRDDSRITRIGSILRRTSLDEVPQLINVLLGDMSIVGPRPHALASTAEDLLFWTIDPTYWDRHVIKPGITGLAQVRGFRGATARRADLSKRLQADLEYVTDWSLWRDVAIVFRTAKVMFHRNAF